MGIPTEAASLPQPPAEDGVVSFGGGTNHQTWRMESPIKDDIYSGKIKSWKRVPSSFTDKAGKPKEQFVFLCSVDGRESDGELSYYTGVSITGHPKEKLGPLLKLLGLPLPTPKSPQLPDPTGRPLRFFVVNQPGKNDPSKSFPKITQVLAAS
jgi:hypothetical protein